MPENNSFAFRRTVREEDKRTVHDIIESSGFFRDDEIEVAVELVEEHLLKGDGSGYEFVFAEMDGRTVGYTCYGLIPCTKHSFDVYWIGVHESMRGKGVGLLLIRETERIINELGGNGIYVETSSRDQYLPTRNFYLKCGYHIEAQFRDFYDAGDDKVVFLKRLRG